MSVRIILGTLIHDWPRFLSSMAGAGRWVLMRNRSDRSSSCKSTRGIRCDWAQTRPLHLCRVFPITATWLLRRSMQDHSILLAEYPKFVGLNQVCGNGADEPDGDPNVSFLIGHRGTDRLPLLLATLRSISVQKGISFECIVVEQDVEPVIRAMLPEWVRYLHCPVPDSDYLYNRSLAFNKAARMAKGEVLILHDNDMLIPECYGAEALEYYQQGFDVSQLKRFIFYLTQKSSAQIVQKSCMNGDVCCEQVIENLCGGGSLSVSKKGYWDIGGMDEDFVGWGGEDDEFWERCQTLKVWEYGMFPVVHLWHKSQPRKRAEDNPTSMLLEEKMSFPVEHRIRQLTKGLHVG